MASPSQENRRITLEPYLMPWLGSIAQSMGTDDMSKAANYALTLLKTGQMSSITPPATAPTPVNPQTQQPMDDAALADALGDLLN